MYIPMPQALGPFKNKKGEKKKKEKKGKLKPNLE